VFFLSSWFNFLFLFSSFYCSTVHLLYCSRAARPLRPNNFFPSSCSSYLRGSIFCFFFPLSTALLFTCSTALAQSVLCGSKYSFLSTVFCLLTSVYCSTDHLFSCSRRSTKFVLWRATPFKKLPQNSSFLCFFRPNPVLFSSFLVFF